MDPYDVIKNSIMMGEFEPGQRLTEEALAEKLKISRTPVRGAIQQLVSDGLAIPFQRRGVVVREFSIDDIRQIYNLRALLESAAASEAASIRLPEDLIEIAKFHTLYETAITNHDKSDISSIINIQQTNQAFHEAIYKATKNEHLHSLIAKVVVVPLVFRSFYWFEEQNFLQSIEAHKTILVAIENSEPERAKAAMQEHILLGRDYVLKNELKINNEIWRGDVQ